MKQAIKKLTAFVLALTVILSSSSFVQAATTSQAKLDKLVELSVIKGDSNGVNGADTMQRYRSAVMMVRLMGLEDEMNAYDYVGKPTFTDAAGKSVYMQRVMAYLKNHPELGVIGYTDGSFKPMAVISAKEHAKIMLEVLGYKQGTDFTWATVSAKALELGLVSSVAQIDADPTFTLSDLAVFTYDGLTLTAKGHVKTLGEELGFVVLAVAAINSVTVTKTNELTVQFNSAVDKTKAIISVKKGSITMNVSSATFAADNKSATLTLASKVTAGEYTVTVAGLTTTALTAKVTAADEKVGKINIVNRIAPRLTNPTAKVTYEVLNQYGEKMTGQAINWSISTGVAIAAEDTTAGTFTITAAAGADFIPGAVVYITGVHAATATVVNAQVEVGLASKSDAVTFKGIYDLTDAKLITSLPAGFANGRYVLLYEVSDQYGNKIATPTFADLVLTSGNPLFVSATLNQAADVVISTVNYEAISLVQGSAVNAGGSLTIQAISTLTGKISAFTTSADALAAVKTFSMSSPADIVAESETLEIPFAAADQYGNAITKFDDLNGNVTLAANLAFVKKDDGTAKLVYTAPGVGASTGTDLPVFLTSLVTAGGNFSSLMIYVKETAVPTAIIGLDSDKSTSIALNNSVEILPEKLVVQDQYGRTISDTNVKAWVNVDANSIVVTSTLAASPFTTGLNGGVNAATVILDEILDVVTVTAVTNAEATEILTFQLATDDDGTDVVAASAKTLTFTKVLKDSYTSFVVDDLGAMYNDGVAAAATDVKWDKTVKAFGVLASGVKVALPATDFTVTTAAKVDVTADVIADLGAAGYVAATDFTTLAGDSKNVTSTILVTINDASGSALAIIEKDLVLTNVVAKVATVTMKSDLVVAGKATMHPLVAAIRTVDLTAFIDTVKDQYGVDIVEAPSITITGLTKVTGSTFTVSNNGSATTSVATVSLGDKFTATYKYASGVSVSVAFTVGVPQ